MTAKQLKQALARKHDSDIFVTECNLGSATQGCRRIDAWAMPRSWSPFRTIGYEIKVTRGDFLRDHKWTEYRDYCHEMWFVCPWKLIDPSELPAEVGLLWLNKGGRLITKRKAVPRGSSEKIQMAMAYILMSRSVITASGDNMRSRVTVEDWREWLKDRQDRHEIGQHVRKAINKRCGEVETRNLKLECENTRWRKLDEALQKLGLNTDHVSAWNIESKLEELRGVVSSGKIRRIVRASSELSELANELEALRGREPLP